MLDLNEVSRLLEESDREFLDSRDETEGEVSAYRKALSALPGKDTSVIASLPGRCGARPLEPLDEGVFVPHGARWEDKAGCQRWMDGVLGGRKVAAVDGGQIYPDRGSGVPVALLQAGVAVNDRGSGLRHRERLSIMGPRQFLESVFHDMPVNTLVDAKRFELECDAAVELMEEGDDVTVLMDYPLLVPHLLGYQVRLRYTYLHAARRLLACSERTGNPVAGFVDRSVSRDLTYMLYNQSARTDPAEGLPRPRWTYDARLLGRYAEWGVRTRAFLLDRDDRRGEGGTSSLDLYEEQGDRIAFLYLCTDGVTFARVEVPRFVCENGGLDGLVDVILAQTALRGNYPDIIHQSHRAASITYREAGMFHNVFTGFCREKGIALDRSAKEMHKRHGRAAGRSARGRRP